MKRTILVLALALFLGCGSMPPRPTVGQELCATGCKLLGGKYHDMTEQDRKCYCVFEMPASINLGSAGPRQTQGQESRLVQTD